MIKKILSLALLASVIIFPRLTFAAGVTVTVANGAGLPGSTRIEIPINVSDTTGQKIISADIELDYDAARLSFASLDNAGTLTSAWSYPVYNNTSGKLYIALFGAQPISGSGKLLKVYFNVKSKAGKGVSALTLVKAKFNNARISSTIKNGTFTVNKLKPAASLKPSR